MTRIEKVLLGFVVLLVGFIGVVYNFVPENEKTPEKRWIIEGYALTTALNLNDRQVTPEALEAAAPNLLKYTTVLFNHEQDRPIGRVLEIKVVDKKLWVKIGISKAESDIWTKIKDGTLSKMSVQFRILDREVDYSEERETAFYRIVKIILVEVSVVSIPADGEARILEWREE